MRNHGTGLRDMRRVFLLGGIAVLLLSGCYRGVDTPPLPADAIPPPPELTPQPLVIDGSALMQPLTAALAEAYQAVNPAVHVEVGASGTRTGFDRFCRGEVAFHDALRAMTESEQALCEANGVGWRVFTLAYDAVAVVVSTENDFADCLNRTQIGSIWRENSVITRWNQINLSYPDLPLVVYVPPSESLTYTLFQELLLRGGRYRSDTYEGLPVGREALGVWPLADALRLGSGLRLLPLMPDNPADGNCFVPDEVAVQNGAYPLARPLLLYVEVGALSRPEVDGFLRFALSEAVDDVIRAQGVIPPGEEMRSLGLAQLN